jgi:uncharacterized LabA/DUF88 family protein
MKAIIIVDGGYLTQIVKNDYDLKHSNLPHSIFNIFENYRSLVKDTDLHLLRIRYHDSPAFLSNNPSSEEQKKYDEKEMIFSRHINSYQRIDLIKGRCQKLSEGGHYSYKQKGVDVNMAIDIVQYSAMVDAIVVSSDSDLIPAFELAKTKGAEIVLVTSNNVNRLPGGSVDSLIRSADLNFMIKKEMLTKRSERALKR